LEIKKRNTKFAGSNSVYHFPKRDIYEKNLPALQ